MKRHFTGFMSREIEFLSSSRQPVHLTTTASFGSEPKRRGKK
jgi:hypothetical protein